MRRLVFKIPDRDLEVLVEVHDDGATLATRYVSVIGSTVWGPPIVAAVDEDSRWQGDLDSGPRPLPDHMRGRQL